MLLFYKSSLSAVQNPGSSRSRVSHCRVELPSTLPRGTTRRTHTQHPWNSVRYEGGESSADVFDRVSSFLDSLWRHWESHAGVRTGAEDVNDSAGAAERRTRTNVNDKAHYDNYVLVVHGTSEVITPRPITPTFGYTKEEPPHRVGSWLHGVRRDVSW